MSRIRMSLDSQRRRIVPSLVAAALVAGVVISIIGTQNAQADYFAGCGYGYNSSGGGFGSGTGTANGYGYLKNGQFGYGYGDQVCPMAVTTATLASGTVGKSYSATLAGTGGATPYVWTETGALPGGLTLSSAGAISGSPTAAGTFNFTVTLTDVNGQTATGSLSITTNKAATKPQFRVIRVAGYARVGRTSTLTIVGVGFYGRPRVTSNERGTKVTVIHDRGTKLVVHVRTPARSKRGRHVLTVRLANGKTGRTTYLVR
jgi:hypothetical protein